MWFRNHSETKARQHIAIILGSIFSLGLLGITVSDHIAVILNVQESLSFPNLENWVFTIGAMLVAIFGLNAFKNGEKEPETVKTP